jgi:hypothetical protein
MGKYEAGAVAFLGAKGAEDVCRCRALIERRRWPCSAFCPTARDLILLADARLVGEPDLYCGRFDALLARDLIQTGGETFLKFSMAPSACAW